MSGATRFSCTVFALLLAEAVTGGADQEARVDDDTHPASKQVPPIAPAPLRATDVDPAEIEDWPPNQPPPTGYRWGSRARTPIVQSGLALWAIAYVPSFFIGMIGNGNLAQSATPSAWLMVPIAGPFILLGDATGSTAKALLITDGAFQAVGAGLITLGLLWQVPILVREQKAASAVRPRLVLRGAHVELGVEGRF